MEKLSAFLLVVITATSQVGAEGQNPLDALRSLSARAFSTRDHKQREADFIEFDKQLLELGRTQRFSPAKGKRTEETMFREIADDRATHPEIHDELKKIYGVVDKRGFAAPLPVPLKNEHATEKYRLAWEGLLLAPIGKEVTMMERRGLITDALRSINNPDSLVALTYCFRSTCADVRLLRETTRDAANAIDRQLHILHCYASNFRSEVGLQSLLDCMEFYRNEVGDNPPLVRTVTLETGAINVLTFRLTRTKDVEWVKTLKKFPTGDLSDYQKLILRTVIEKSDK